MLSSCLILKFFLYFHTGQILEFIIFSFRNLKPGNVILCFRFQVCFLATMISASLLFQGIKEKYIGSEVLEEVAYGVAASVIGLVLEVVTLVLHTQNMLSKVDSLRQPILVRLKHQLTH